jgi:hypothetical protein
MGDVVSLSQRRARFSRPPRRAMHRKKIVCAKFYALPLQGKNQGVPRGVRDAATLFPLLDGPAVLADVGRHLRKRVPASENIVNGAHGPQYASDELSGQAPSMIPMTTEAAVGTISPMGRASTPARFRLEMARRLSSARIVAGYATKKQASDKLGITLDRYEKWETGRTPVPAQYVGPVCELFHVDANYLFGIEAAQASRKTG